MNYLPFLLLNNEKKKKENFINNPITQYNTEPVFSYNFIHGAIFLHVENYGSWPL